jgi:hypothetical protein
LVIFLLALVIGLLGAVGYLLRKLRAKPSTALAKTSADELAKQSPTTPLEGSVVPKSEKIDLTSLVPVDPPVRISDPASNSKT